ncbi:Nad dependent epimerase dehydratase [Lasiodiplodia theobromae]|uniref:Nad dependent epimerase dehydratase n=1 Tax=Lasiodiplodia theobromae TaxID=45133 RepID=UPI0015C3AA3E|nr:Nad dependent epimerase dehydratase [Lasiodiplodia theobromae]KAF4537169.1 Nad dependent epimerase dehydratase [Lasiodiplodia theobromae]
MSTTKTSETRTRPMGVLVLGQSRTGTSSMRAALQHLGYTRVFHFFSLFENPLQTPTWQRAFQAKFLPPDDPSRPPPFTRDDWDALLGPDCTALTDTPCHIFAEELMAAYPEAKVVLTVRDSTEAWYDSYSTTIWPFLEAEAVAPTLWWRVVQALRPRMPFGYLDVMHSCMARFTDLGAIPERGRQYYEERNAVVKELAGDRLLVFNVKEGWEPLCKHLGLDVPPKTVPFPRMFDGQEFGEMWKQWCRGSVVGAMLNLGKGIVVTAAVVWTWKAYVNGGIIWPLA